jgi:hypothetical protein
VDVDSDEKNKNLKRRLSREAWQNNDKPGKLMTSIESLYEFHRD